MATAARWERASGRPISYGSGVNRHVLPQSRPASGLGLDGLIPGGQQPKIAILNDAGAAPSGEGIHLSEEADLGPAGGHGDIAKLAFAPVGIRLGEPSVKHIGGRAIPPAGRLRNAARTRQHAPPADRVSSRTRTWPAPLRSRATRSAPWPH